MPIFRLLCLILLSFNLALAGNPFEEGNKLVTTTILQDRTEFQPSHSDLAPAGYIGIKFEIEPGWHIYWANSGESGQPTAVNWVVPEGWQVGDLEWPAPTKFIERGNIITYGYEGSVLLTAPIFNPQEVPNGPVEIEVQASSAWLVCKDICVPGQRDQNHKFIFSTQDALTPSNYADQFKIARNNSPKEAPKNFPIAFDTISKSIVISLPTNPNLALEKISNAIQFFPESSDLLTLHPAALSQTKSGVQVVVPVSKIGKLQTNSVQVGGVLLTAPNLLLDTPSSALTFKLNLTEENLANIPAKPTLVEGLPLQYQVVHHDRDVSPVPRKLIVDDTATKEKPAQGNLLTAILLALVAGVILNVMPCVLPVLSIKVISLSLHRQLSRVDRIKYSLAYLLGIEFTFAILASTVGLLKQAGMEVGWGFQFQQPVFVYSLAIVVFAFSLGFFDYYFVTIPGSQLLDKKVTKLKSPMVKSFGEGILITLLSTPCTAPFLGTALAFAFSQSTTLIILVFLAIGLGLALPYLLVAAIPALAERIPKPGHWMRSVKELMGFLLLGTVIWLLYVLDSLSPSAGITTLGVLLWLAFLIWFGRHIGVTPFWKYVRYPLLLVLIGLPIIYLSPQAAESRVSGMPAASGPITWSPYTPETAKSLLQKEQYVFIDFTADWCITCKFNERFFLSSTSLAGTFKRLSFNALKADWTDGSKLITDALESYGGHGVPLYVMLSPDGRIEVLPTILTPGLVEERAEAFIKNKK